jgi:hypothetical protein
MDNSMHIRIIDRVVDLRETQSENRQNIEDLIKKQNKKHIEKITSLKDENNNDNSHTDLIEAATMKKGQSNFVLNVQPPAPASQPRLSVFKNDELIKLTNTKINQGALQGLNIFHRKYQTGFVDVWWLYDDGGLTILLPYLLMKRKYWQKCKLRIFIQTKNTNTNICEEQRRFFFYQI